MEVERIQRSSIAAKCPGRHLYITHCSHVYMSIGDYGELATVLKCVHIRTLYGDKSMVEHLVTIYELDHCPRQLSHSFEQSVHFCHAFSQAIRRYHCMQEVVLTPSSHSPLPFLLPLYTSQSTLPPLLHPAQSEEAYATPPSIT